MIDLETPVVLFTAGELYEAQAVHDALEEQGISARIEGEFLTTVLGDVPLGSTTAPRVMVKEADEPAARAILDRLRAEFQQARAAAASDQLCLACGADMHDAQMCPACGWTFEAGAHDREP